MILCLSHIQLKVPMHIAIYRRQNYTSGYYLYHENKSCSCKLPHCREQPIFFWPMNVLPIVKVVAYDKDEDHCPKHLKVSLHFKMFLINKIQVYI